MSAEFNRLMRLLEQELIHQEKLLDLLGRERAAIVHLRRDQIESLRQRKEEVLSEAKSVGDKRNEVIRSLLGTKQPNDPLKFSSVLERCPTQDLRRKLNNIGDQLKSVASTVRDMNSQNGEMIRQSLGLLASTIAIFRAAPGADLPTYNESGSLNAPEDPAFSGGGGTRTIIREA